MPSTQESVTIEEIAQDLVLLRDGGVSLVLTTTAVNFGLLFEAEQQALIYSFAGLLNSLSFPIQIVVFSRLLDISSYLTKLDQVQLRQVNQKLQTLTSNYRQFVKSLIKENDVLDKQFYICIFITGVELGILKKSPSERIKKALILLTPRRDHLIRQLSRIGLKARQLTSTELLKVYFDMYNLPVSQTIEGRAQGKEPTILPFKTPAPRPPQINTPANPTKPATYYPAPPNLQRIPSPPRPASPPSKPFSLNSSTPFVVEELGDDLSP